MTLLRVERLAKAYLGVKAVDDVSFTVGAGEIAGLIGPNGSGKSTTIDCLSAFQRADGGRWHLGDVELTGRAPHAIARLGLTRTFQAIRCYESLSLVENLLCATEARQAIGWRDAFFATARLHAHDRLARAKAVELLDLVGLTRYADAPAGVLSYGQRKLLALAGALMTEPKLILLDEPVAGVNPTMIRTIERAIERINAAGIALLIVEHNVEFITNLCHRVIVLEQGRKLTEGTAAEIHTDSRVLEAYLGLSPEMAEAEMRGAA